MLPALEQLTKTTVQLLLDEPFFGHLSAAMVKEVSSELDTVGLRPSEDQILILSVHPQFGNKVDKENCTPDEVHEAVFDLMFELGAEEWQLDFPTVYGSAKHNWMSEDWQQPTDTIQPLLDMVIEHIPSPKVENGTTQMLITSLDYSSFTGRIAIGRYQSPPDWYS